ncbi:hypothetical protein PV325_013273, partial [Microctonus aethiopoides]
MAMTTTAWLDERMNERMSGTKLPYYMFCWFNEFHMGAMKFSLQYETESLLCTANIKQYYGRPQNNTFAWPSALNFP